MTTDARDVPKYSINEWTALQQQLAEAQARADTADREYRRALDNGTELANKAIREEARAERLESQLAAIREAVKPLVQAYDRWAECPCECEHCDCFCDVLDDIAALASGADTPTQPQEA